MGVIYCGPYAEQVGSHEGYGARVLPDGSLTGIWTYETREFLGWVAACDCGWHGETRYPPTDAGEAEAIAEWSGVHLQPLIVTAQLSWPAWAERVAARARAAAEHIAAGRAETAALVIDRLDKEIQAWARIARELANEHR
jgi:hypothetical protein